MMRKGNKDQLLHKPHINHLLKLLLEILSIARNNLK